MRCIILRIILLASLLAAVAIDNKTRRAKPFLTAVMDSRARMLAEVSSGGSTSTGGDASTLRILGRGCDPVMAERSAQMLPPMLGGAQIQTATDDDNFIELLSTQKYDVIFFAPGACRWSAARKPIPGGNAKTAGWGLDKYRELATHWQPSARIVETIEEREIVPLLRAALGLKD